MKYIPLLAAFLLIGCQPVEPDESNIANFRLVKLCPSGEKLYRLDEGGELAIYDGSLWVKLEPGITPESFCPSKRSDQESPVGAE